MHYPPKQSVMHPATSIARALYAALLATVLAGCSSIQTQPGSSSAEAVSSDAAWRVATRLGYGLAPGTMLTMQGRSAKAWAVQQLDAAYGASQQPANVPTELQGIQATLPSLLADFRAERDAQKILREVKTVTMPSMTSSTVATIATGTATATLAAQTTTSLKTPEPQFFSRDISLMAASWRITACSDPAVENAMLARMTEFWFNHLNVFAGKGTVRPFVGHYVLNVVRANALGKFEDLLLASAKHPAMLHYLDQAQSAAPGTNQGRRGLNENYARELMELHTLGVNTVYSQNDVRELARILTGWTIDLGKVEGFVFAKGLHDTGNKTLLGTLYTNRGVAEGEDAIKFLARHPATAQRISSRLASFFVADKPPAALVNRLSKTFMETQGDIRAVMRTLIESSEFWQADQTLFKTPMDYACSVLTAAGGVKDKRDINQSLGFLAQAGQPLHGWQTPDGYKTDAATWLAPEALTRRADHAMGMAARMTDISYLQPFFSSSTRERIAREAPQQRTGLLLASPEFMRK
jgi:uncharacterized protein (DUF1800 family)